MRIKRILASVLAAAIAVSATAISVSAEAKSEALGLKDGKTTYELSATVDAGGLYFGAASTVTVNLPDLTALTAPETKINGVAFTGSTPVQFGTLDAAKLTRGTYSSFTITVKGTADEKNLANTLKELTASVVYAKVADSKADYDADTTPLKEALITTSAVTSTKFAVTQSTPNETKLIGGTIAVGSDEAKIAAIQDGAKLVITLKDKLSANAFVTMKTNISGDTIATKAVSKDATTIEFDLDGFAFKDSLLGKTYLSEITLGSTVAADVISAAIVYEVEDTTEDTTAETTADTTADTTAETTADTSATADDIDEPADTGAAALVVAPAIISAIATIISKKRK